MILTEEEQIRAKGLFQCPRCGRWLLKRHLSRMTGMCIDWADCMRALWRIPAPENQ